MAELRNRYELAASPPAAVPKNDGTNAEARPSLKDLLLSNEARTDDLVPARRRRPLPALD
jgi:hypothetical protein